MDSNHNYEFTVQISSTHPPTENNKLLDNEDNHQNYEINNRHHHHGDKSSKHRHQEKDAKNELNHHDRHKGNDTKNYDNKSDHGDTTHKARRHRSRKRSSSSKRRYSDDSDDYQRRRRRHSDDRDDGSSGSDRHHRRRNERKRRRSSSRNRKRHRKSGRDGSHRHRHDRRSRSRRRRDKRSSSREYHRKRDRSRDRHRRHRSRTPPPTHHHQTISTTSDTANAATIMSTHHPHASITHYQWKNENDHTQEALKHQNDEHNTGSSSYFSSQHTNEINHNVQFDTTKKPFQVIPVGISLNNYKPITQVGEGTFGKVFKAERLCTGEFVALKRVKIETEKEGFPVSAIREIRLLTYLKHKNVVQLKELLSSIYEDKGIYIYLVFEYMEHDLTGILSHGIKFSVPEIKCLTKQIFEGLDYLHDLGIMHRDLKGSNLLLNAKGELKLADFGLARFKFSSDRAKNVHYTNRVITLWYRPPELLLGCTKYDYAVDMWSAGCILLELYEGRPIFNGKDEVTQLEKIWKICGTPNVEEYLEIQSLPWWQVIQPKSTYPNRIEVLFGEKLSLEALNLIKSLLSIKPSCRPNTRQVLLHPFLTTEKPNPCSPSSLPFIQGDWHEFESKQTRKKLTSNPIPSTLSQPNSLNAN